MKSITIDPLSALIGAGVLGLALLAGGAVQARQQAVAIPSPTITLVLEEPIDVIASPSPEDIIIIEEGSPYVVPPDRMFVVTAVGSSGDNGIYLMIDGVQAYRHSLSTDGSSFGQVPPHLVVRQGSLIDVTGHTSARAWGYLVDA